MGRGGQPKDETTVLERAATLLRGQTVLEAVAESTSDAVYVKDREGRYLLINGAACRAVGKSRDDLLGRDDSALFPSDDAQRVRAMDVAVMESGETRTVEETLIANGVPTTFLATKGPVRDEAGVVVGLFGISRDITERKRMEEALRESEMKFRSVFTQSPVGKSITKLTGEVEFNPAMCAMLGYSSDELRNVRFQDLTHPDDVALRERSMQEVLSGERDAVRFVKRYRRKDGAVVWADINITLRRDALGRPLDFLSSVVDITERRRAEDALRESEDKFRYMFDHGAMGMSITHLDGAVELNPAALEMLGRTAAEARGGRWQDMSHPDDIAATQREIDALRGGEKAVARFTKRFLRPDGSVVWAELSSTLRRDAAGAPLYMLTSLLDITERVRAEEALRESEYFFRESQRVANIGSYRADFVRGVWRSSEVLDRIFGLDESREHPVSEWIAVIHPDDQPRMTTYLQQEVLGAGRTFDAQYRIVRVNDGAVRWVHGLGELSKDPAGRVLVMTGTIQDITERRQAEEALRTSEERHRAILRGALDGFWVVDMDGRILEVNDTYCRMSGYTEAELLTMRFYHLVGDETPEEIAARTHDIVAHGGARFESRHVRKDGSSYPVAISVQHRLVDGRGMHVAFIQDITARKQAEDDRAAMQAQLQQAQKMESVGRLAGGVAHDFNNMLGVILGNVDLALEQVAVGDPLREDLEEVRRAAVRSVDLTRQLLAFARKQTVAPQVLDLNVTVSGMLKMLQRLIGEDIVLDWRPQEALWPVKVDPSQVDQVLANLCVNARDAISGTGHLTIRTGQRTFTAADLVTRPDVAAGEYVLLAVIDDGTGMGPEVLSHLFEPFFTTKSMGKGTGLGLATVWGIVRQNNGFIDVTSEPGRGSAFHIYLPRHVGKAAHDRSDGTAGASHRGSETILVAEDEPGILALTARMLERQGYRVLRASTPGEAIRIAQEHRGEIDLLMTDVVMPEMNGRDLARQLLTLYPNMKRVFMSGYTADVIAHRGVLDSGVHFIQKPFAQEALTRKVREVLDAT